VTIDGATVELVAFYFPGTNAPWDDVYAAPFLGNFWICRVRPRGRRHLRDVPHRRGGIPGHEMVA
jgi:hypothetical protein